MLEGWMILLMLPVGLVIMLGLGFFPGQLMGLVFFKAVDRRRRRRRHRV